jgi:glycosyltransferase involved in cell wall biosynthesis
MRVLMVCHYYPPHVGGIENVVHDEAVRLAELGHQVTVLTSGERTSIVDEVGDDGNSVRVVRIAAWNGAERRAGVPFPVLSPRLLPQALRWARWAQVVHIHDCFYLTSWAAGLASAVARVPVVLTQHVAMVEHPSRAVMAVQRLVYGTVGRALLRRARVVFTINEFIARFVGAFGADPAKVVVLGNGVDGQLFRPAADEAERREIRARFGLPEDRTLALFVGRLVPKKGIGLVLAALETDSADNAGKITDSAAAPALDLVVVGSGDPALLAGRERVHFLGEQPTSAVAEIYRACDLFVLPTTGEVFPLVVKEAMSAALPVVTTDEPDYARYGLDAEGVALVRREPQALRRAMAAIAADGALRERMGSYAAQYAAKQFSWSEHLATLVHHYRSATAKRRGSGGEHG